MKYFHLQLWDVYKMHTHGLYEMNHRSRLSIRSRENSGVFF